MKNHGLVVRTWAEMDETLRRWLGGLSSTDEKCAKDWGRPQIVERAEQSRVDAISASGLLSAPGLPLATSASVMERPEALGVDQSAGRSIPAIPTIRFRHLLVRQDERADLVIFEEWPRNRRGMPTPLSWKSRSRAKRMDTACLARAADSEPGIVFALLFDSARDGVLPES